MAKNKASLFAIKHLSRIYSEQDLLYIIHQIEKIGILPQGKGKKAISQEEICLITYGDSIKSNDKYPLSTLALFLQDVRGIINMIHILPFFSYSSDDGFAVTDYDQVDKKIGSWKDINKLANRYSLIFDGVINHVSMSHPWIKEHPEYFLQYTTPPSSRGIFRPRAHNLFTKKGSKYIWTTFSRDQADLNYANPDVFIEVYKILREYVKNGAKYIRLDAVAYLYKKLGTKCINLTETHEIVKAYKALFGNRVDFIAEVNLDEDSIASYLGKSGEEAQMIYNFPLAPLTYYATKTGDVTPLMEAITSMQGKVRGRGVAFNFLASHDGIGLLPAKKYISKQKRELLEKDVIRKGFKVSYKSTKAGKEAYELNINYLDALDGSADKMIMVHMLLLSLQGVPAIYIHSLIGSTGDKKYDKKHPRSVNREKLSYANITRKLKDKRSREYEIYEGIKNGMRIRRTLACMSPQSGQMINSPAKGVVCITRKKWLKKVVCFYNFSDVEKVIEYSNRKIKLKEHGFIWLNEKGNVLATS